MVLDYSERKPVGKNRPRKQPVGILTIILIGAVSISFALGLLSGWFLFKPARKTAQDRGVFAHDGTKGAPGSASPAAQLQNPEASAAKSAEPPLTFYETLPKGGKAVIGSGLNPKKAEPLPAHNSAAAALPSPPQPAAPPVSPPAKVKPEERKEPPHAPAEPTKKTAAPVQHPPQQQPAAAGKFCVQVASSTDRKEAEAIKAKMADKGLTAYVVDSNIKEKGTWYRVRIGRHLTQQSAGELAAKAGKGALVIPE
jgi:cell division protein FtsN